MIPTPSKTQLHVGPFVLFMAFVGLLELLAVAGFTKPEGGSWYRQHPRQWVYPLQTVVCLCVLAMWWRRYEFGPHRGWLLALGAGILGILIWVLPGNVAGQLNESAGWLSWLGCVSRTDGFDPGALASVGSGMYWGIVAVRIIRMVVVVPVVEELFWRGFLMRFTVDLDGDYWQVPFGTYHPRSLIIVTLAFVMAHSSVDYAAALVFGLLMYGVAVRTKSLSACILMHAIANLLLGIYILLTRQWGYW